MGLSPRKRPEGLIDGCFGRSSYCPSCDYHIDDCTCYTKIGSGGIITSSPINIPLKHIGGNLYEMYGEYGREIVELIDKEKDNEI